MFWRLMLFLDILYTPRPTDPAMQVTLQQRSGEGACVHIEYINIRDYIGDFWLIASLAHIYPNQLEMQIEFVPLLPYQ